MAAPVIALGLAHRVDSSSRYRTPGVYDAGAAGPAFARADANAAATGSEAGPDAVLGTGAGACRSAEDATNRHRVGAWAERAGPDASSGARGGGSRSDRAGARGRRVVGASAA